MTGPQWSDSVHIDTDTPGFHVRRSSYVGAIHYRWLEFVDACTRNSILEKSTVASL